MISIIRTLFNNGVNDGNIIIKPSRTPDKIINCHNFVLKKTCKFFEEGFFNNSSDGIIELDSHYDVLIVVFNFIYSENILDRELSCSQIIDLFNIISQLRCNDSILLLKNHYLKKFSLLLNESNWIQTLKIIYGVSKYFDLKEEILKYYRINILNNIDNNNIVLINSQFKDLTGELKDVLFEICLEKIVNLNTELKIISDLTEQKNNDKIKLNNCLKKFAIEDLDEDDSGGNGSMGDDDDNNNNNNNLVLKKKEKVVTKKSNNK